MNKAKVVGICLILLGAILAGMATNFLPGAAGGGTGLAWLMGLLGLGTAGCGAYIALTKRD
jgi:hypothetical protein